METVDLFLFFACLQAPPMITLYHSGTSTCAQKVRFVLTEKELAWESKELDLRAGDQFTAEYLKLNPKGVVPTLIDDGEIVTESAIICQYLDEKYPGRSFTPDDPLTRARMRQWLYIIDDYIHLDTSTISFAIMFRHQLRAAHPTEEGLRRHLSSTPDLKRRAVLTDVVLNGIDAVVFEAALTRYLGFIERMKETLAGSPYLVGDTLTLADIFCLPYIARLEHLAMGTLWQEHENIVRWFAAMKETEGYREACAKWIPEKVVKGMQEKGRADWPKIQEKLSALR